MEICTRKLCVRCPSEPGREREREREGEKEREGKRRREWENGGRDKESERKVYINGEESQRR